MTRLSVTVSDADRARHKKREKSIRPPRRVYHAHDQLRAAYFAGNGKSASEIAEIIGGTTRVRVHAMLRKCGLALIPKVSNEAALLTLLKRTELQALQSVAVARDADAGALAGQLLAVLVREPVLMANLLDDAEATA